MKEKVNIILTGRMHKSADSSRGKTSPWKKRKDGKERQDRKREEEKRTASHRYRKTKSAQRREFSKA